MSNSYLNYTCQGMQMTEFEQRCMALGKELEKCDDTVKLTKLMNKYPKGSPERSAIKRIRFGVAFGGGRCMVEVTR